VVFPVFLEVSAGDVNSTTDHVTKDKAFVDAAFTEGKELAKTKQ